MPVNHPNLTRVTAQMTVPFVVKTFVPLFVFGDKSHVVMRVCGCEQTLLPSDDDGLLCEECHQSSEDENYLWYGNRQMLCFPLQVPKPSPVTLLTAAEDVKHYEESRTCVEDLALYLKPLSNTRGPCCFT